jgi:hypothetical protein
MFAGIATTVSIDLVTNGSALYTESKVSVETDCFADMLQNGSALNG